MAVKITCPLGQIIQSPLSYVFKYVPKLRAVTENEEMGTPWDLSNHGVSNQRTICNLQGAAGGMSVYECVCVCERERKFYKLPLSRGSPGQIPFVHSALTPLAKPEACRVCCWIHCWIPHSATGCNFRWIQCV